MTVHQKVAIGIYGDFPHKVIDVKFQPETLEKYALRDPNVPTVFVREVY